MALYLYDICSQATFLEALGKAISLALHNDVPFVVIHLDMRLLLNHFEQKVTAIQEHYYSPFVRVHSYVFSLSFYEFLTNNHIFPWVSSFGYDENPHQSYH